MVINILKGGTTGAAAARKRRVTVREFDEWREKYQQDAVNAFRALPRDEDALKAEYTEKMQQKVGQVALELDTLREATNGCPSCLEDVLGVKQVRSAVSARRIYQMRHVSQ